MNNLPEIAENLIKATHEELRANGAGLHSVTTFINRMRSDLQRLLDVPATVRDVGAAVPERTDSGPSAGDSAAITARILDAYKRGGGRMRPDRAA